MKLNELILKKRKNGEMLVWSRQIKCEPERGAVHAVGTDQRESIKMRLLVQTWPMNDRWAAISARKYVQLFKRNLFRKLLFFCIFRKKYFRHLWSLLTCSFRFCCFIPTTGRNSGRNESVSIRPTAWIRTSFHASGPQIEGKPDEIWEAVHDHIQYLSSGPWFMAFLLKFPRIWSEFGHWKN